MISLVFSALRERRSQTLSLFLLTVVAAVGGCAAPWFASWAHQAVASADIAAAPLPQKLITVTGSIRYAPGDPSPLVKARQVAGDALPIPDGEIVTAMNLFTQATRPDSNGASPVNLTVGYRDDVCAHLIVTGACPTATGQILLGRRIAAELRLGPGDQITISALEISRPVTLTISGLYDIADALSPYWASGPGDAVAVSRPLDESAYTTEQTLLAELPNRVDIQYQLVVPATAFHDSGGPLAATLAKAGDRLAPALSLATTADVLIAQLRQDQSLVSTGVDLAAVQLVLLCWFALYLAVRYTSDTRRPDIGLLRLRGTKGWRVWGLIAAQSGVPMIAGAAVGLGLGYLAAATLARSWPAGSRPLLGAAAVAAGVGLGALAVCLAAESRSLRASVATLMRRVPARGGGWRTSIGDVLVIVVAVAGVYQGYADLKAGGSPSILALLAPGLLGLAVAVLAARGVPYVARWAGTAALGAGRTGLALTALHVARRPGTQRVFAVVAVAVSVLATTLFFWQTATDAWQRRAVAELGAARVLSVQAPSSASLMADVRAADPSGRYAMAVARGAGGPAADQVLAVDTSRLAAVGQLPAELGLPDPATLARALHPRDPVVPSLTDGPATVDVDLDGTPTSVMPVRLRLHLVDPAGGWHPVDFGPLQPGRRGYTAVVGDCPDGCRLAALEPVTQRPQASLAVYGVTQSGRAVVSDTQLGDIANWRPPSGPADLGTQIAAGDGRLTLSLYSGPFPRYSHLDRRVFVAAAPTPVPVAVVGDLIDTTSRPGDARITVLGESPVTYAVVARGSVLPRLGSIGAVMDLDYAELSLSDPSEAVGLEVWLSADAPSSIVDALTQRGVRVLGEQSIASVTDRLREQGPGLALRFELFAAVVLLLVAAGTIVVSSTVERRSRAEELAALRAQGLAERTVRGVTYGGLGVLAGAATAVGLLAALLAAGVTATALPVFADAWDLLPVREGAWAGQALLAAVASLVVLGGAAGLGARWTVAAVRAHVGGDR
jgi:hypothetical protein